MTTSRRKISKKNKSSWRKHSNIKDVEEFLHEKSEVERIESLCSKNDELFTVDTGIQSTINRLPLSAKQKRKLNALKKSPNSITNQQQQQRETKNTEVLNPKQRRIIRAMKSGQHEKKWMKKQKKSTRNPLKRDFSKNLWTQSEDDNKEKFQEYQGEWISKELALHHLHGTGRELVKVHQSAHHKTSRLKAFQPPHPGTSYNPSYKDYQLLINDVIEKEKEIIKEEQHLKRVTTDMFDKIPATENNTLKHLENMTDPELEIKIEPKEENQNDENNGDSIVTVNKKRKEKKLKSTKNKELKVKRLQKEQKMKKEKKKLITDLHRLKSLVKDVTKEENEINEKIHKRKLKQIQKKYEPKRLSKIKYKDTDIAVTMPNEIPSGLRSVKNETKLIVDKFNDFQKRNILPVSVDVGTRKRRKVKRFTRKSHKE